MNLASLRQVAAAATPGPWQLYEKGRYFYIKGSGSGHTFVLQRRKYMGQGEDSRISSDCHLIAAMNPQVALALIAVAEAAAKVSPGLDLKHSSIVTLHAALAVLEGME